MKRISLVIIPCILVFLPAWRSGEPSIQGGGKHRVNFYGKLKTRHTKKTIPVDNISIERKYNQIRVKEKPDKHPKPIPVTNKKGEKTNKREIKLDFDPNAELATTKLDLSEIDRISVPKPDVIWSYQKEAHYGKRKFIEIVVISKGKRKTKARYLIERKARLCWYEINEAGAQEKVVQLPALDYVTIEGYAFREPQKQQTARPLDHVDKNV